MMKSCFLTCMLAGAMAPAFAVTYKAATANEAVQYLNNAHPGDTVVLLNGLYEDAKMKFHVNGTAHSPIVFKAEAGGRVVFGGDSYLHFSGKHLIVDGFVWKDGGQDLGRDAVVAFRTSANSLAEHSVLQNCMIDSFNNKDKEQNNNWVALYGQRNKVVSCTFKGKDNLGPTLTVWLQEGMVAGHEIAHNFFWGRTNATTQTNGLETMRIGDSKTSMQDASCTVLNNRFEDCDGEIELISNKSCGNKYLQNLFYNNEGGLTLRHGRDCLVSGNYFYGKDKVRSAGIRIIGRGHVVMDNLLEGLLGGNQRFRSPICLVNGIVNTPLNGYEQVIRASVKGNTIVDCGGAAFGIGDANQGATLAPDSVDIAHNFVYIKDPTKQSPIKSSTGYAGISLVENQCNESTSSPGWLPVSNKVAAKHVLAVKRKFAFLLEMEVGPPWDR